MKTEFTSEEALIKLAQNGDTQAYSELVKRYEHRIKQVICFYTNNWANVADLSQEVCIKLFKFLPDFNGSSRFSTWLFRIIQNTIKNHFRSCSTRELGEQAFKDAYMHDKTLSPEFDLEEMEMESILIDALSHLSKDLKTCYRLHVLDGCTYEEIALKLECPIGTVRSRISRARQYLLLHIEPRKCN